MCPVTGARSSRLARGLPRTRRPRTGRKSVGCCRSHAAHQGPLHTSDRLDLCRDRVWHHDVVRLEANGLERIHGEQVSRLQGQHPPFAVPSSGRRRRHDALGKPAARSRLCTRQRQQPSTGQWPSWLSPGPRVPPRGQAGVDPRVRAATRRHTVWPTRRSRAAGQGVGARPSQILVDGLLDRIDARLSQSAAARPSAQNAGGRGRATRSASARIGRIGGSTAYLAVPVAFLSVLWVCLARSTHASAAPGDAASAAPGDAAPGALAPSDFFSRAFFSCTWRACGQSPVKSIDRTIGRW